jgi:hypothetical protein
MLQKETAFKCEQKHFNWHFAIVCAVFTMLFLTDALYLSRNRPSPYLEISLGMVVIKVVVFGLFLRWIARMRRNKIIVGPRGVGCLTILGICHEVVWDDILSVKTNGTWLEAKSLSRPKLRLLIPLFLDDQAGFYAYVSETAPPENPLRVWIEGLPEGKASSGA